MQPKGRAVVLTHSNCLGSILLNFMILWMSRIVFGLIFVASLRLEFGPANDAAKMKDARF